MTLRPFAIVERARGILASTGRMTTLLFSGSMISIAAAASITIISISGAQQNSFERQNVIHKAEDVARILIASPPEKVDSILAYAAEPAIKLKLDSPSPERRLYLEKAITPYLSAPLRDRLGDETKVHPDLAGQEYRPRNPLLAARDALGLSSGHLAYVIEGSGSDFWRISIPVNDGLWLSVETSGSALPQAVPSIAWFFIAITVTIAICSIVALRRLTDPLRALEQAAIQFGRDLDAPPLAERGPGDIRRVAHAFNQMQSQLRRFVTDRTTMLAAISHDLRSPLQRLKFRADFMADEEQREKMLRDLRDMESMIAATLDFARADADKEIAEWHDLGPMLRTIADELRECGYRVSVTSAPETVPYLCRGRALRRAVENLAANAAAYGGEARLSIERGETSIDIAVDDDGPGLPQNEIEAVFTPFHRTESSRNPHTGGTGLGLSIARSIARSHGGDIFLTNRQGGGLTARFTLPI